MKQMLVFLSVAVTASFAPAKEVVFSVMGCGPYNEEERGVMLQFIADENKAATAEFLVHLGDIVSGKVSGKGGLPESYYAGIRENLLRSNSIPTYIVIGDNEWNDRPDHEAGWTYWSKHLMHLDKHFDTPWKTKYQKKRPENFAFVHGGVLFIGLNLPGGTVHDEAEWEQRHRHNAAWVKRRIKKHGEQVRAAVLFFQAAPKPAHESFIKPFEQIARDFAKPMLLLHADIHRWKVTPEYLADNVLNLQIDKIKAGFPPLQVRVLEEGDALFQWDRRLK